LSAHSRSVIWRSRPFRTRHAYAEAATLVVLGAKESDSILSKWLLRQRAHAGTRDPRHSRLARLQGRGDGNEWFAVAPRDRDRRSSSAAAKLYRCRAAPIALSNRAFLASSPAFRVCGPFAEFLPSVVCDLGSHGCRFEPCRVRMVVDQELTFENQPQKRAIFKIASSFYPHFSGPRSINRYRSQDHMVPSIGYTAFWWKIPCN
jgi:hypothetical protein